MDKLLINFPTDITAIILQPIKTEPRHRNLLGRIWQCIRKSLGILLIQPESFLADDSFQPVSSLLYQEVCNIATNNRYRKEDIEIVRSRQVLSANEITESITLFFQKQQVCQATLKITWSNDGVTTEASAPFCLLSRLLLSKHLVIEIHISFFCKDTSV